MSILVNHDTRVICQGITGKVGEFHTRGCLDYGTRMVGGVTPGKGGDKVADLPVFNTVAEARDATGCNATMIFVPPAFAADAILEAVGAGIELIVAITEGIPVLDMARVLPVVEDSDSRLIGPNCPGIITPAACKIGIMPGFIHKPGRVGVISKSGTLTLASITPYFIEILDFEITFPENKLFIHFSKSLALEKILPSAKKLSKCFSRIS